MIIPVVLNGNKTVFDADPSDKLITVLRALHFFSVKTGCGNGICGSCTVLLDGKPVPSCKIPVALVRDSEIVTLEHFLKSEDYDDIANGFEKAGIHLCGYCDAGKIFTAWDIINTRQRLERSRLYEEIRGLSLCCTEPDVFINGILYASSFRNSRIGQRKNAEN